jgi:hypothetical protein
MGTGFVDGMGLAFAEREAEEDRATSGRSSVRGTAEGFGLLGVVLVGVQDFLRKVETTHVSLSSGISRAVGMIRGEDVPRELLPRQN